MADEMIFVIQATGYALTALLFVYLAWLTHRAGLAGVLTGFLAFAVALMRWSILSLARGGIWVPPDHWLRYAWVGAAQAWMMVFATLLAIADLAGWLVTNGTEEG